MKAILEEGRSIYLQIAQSIEEDIMTGLIAEEDAIPSTNQLARHYAINPATAAKGVSLLAEEGIIYKRRGIGMYVKAGARKIIIQKRKKEFSEGFIASIEKAFELGITKLELIKIIEESEKSAK